MELIDKEKLINEINTRAEEEALDFKDIRDMVEFAPTVKAVPLDKVKKAREEIRDSHMLLIALEIIDKLIQESEE